MKHTSVLFLILLLALASSAFASHFTVVLTNGTSFETRERPVSADWDPSISMMRTDVGNWIALPSSEIADVVSREEASGFGYRIDTATVVIGTAPTDLGGVGGEGGASGDDSDGGNEGTVGAGQSRFELPDLTPPPDFRLEQFVTIPADGHLGGDVPAEPTGF